MHGPTLPGLFPLILTWATMPTGEGAFVQHDDWLLVCDNTLTCRAAGYGPDDGSRPVSLLLTREAGPARPLKAEVQLGEPLDTVETPAGPTFPLTLHIDGRALGEVVREGGGSTSATLSPAQTDALLDALRRDGCIAWTTPGHADHFLSTDGVSAVLREMDEVQGRVGTPGALVAPGPRGESTVRAPLPAPVIHGAGTDDTGIRLGAAERGALVRELGRQLERGACPEFRAGDAAWEAANIEVTRLSGARQLVSAPCWRAAYNEGYAYWVVNARAPYRPVLVTTDGSHYARGRLESSHKGRGQGDCWTFLEWVWDGQSFVASGASTRGLCRGFPGGAWTLPRRVSEIREGTPAPRSAE